MTTQQPKLTIVPLTFRAACAYVAKFHRHHKPPRGMKFTIGVADETGQLRGVAMVGRPVGRGFDDGFTVEVNRTCTDGCPNANSCLYRAAWRVAKNMGYRRIITYTQEDESGSSLHASGFIRVRDIPARGSWAESSVKLKSIRDPVGTGNTARVLWEIRSGR